ncbi:uncharacterized protein LOC112690943 [Sipha flava]|uniref:Uncharacterized protein LOC112690943 n=1 Tax=Sipha flava TaxID=143950 RepID=A0A8B8GDU0_9HEMI|nr:uncharacterized protein LOC112690943 [Sipha flava]
MLCYSCNDDIFEEDSIECTSCNEFFHFMCVSLKEVTFRKMSKLAKSKWTCSKCKYMDKKDSPPQIKTLQTNKNTSTDNNFINLTESVNFMSDKFDSFGEQLKEILSEMKQMREENRELKNQNIKFKNEITLLGNRINILEQKALDNFIEVIGIPEIQNEVCADTAKLILAKLNEESSVKKAFRVQSRDSKKPRKLVIEVNTPQCSSKIISSSKIQKPRGITFHDQWGNEPIYVNNFLTLYNRNLLFKTKDFAREAGFKYVWFKNSKLFIKKNENHKAVLIENESSLSLL